MLFRDEVTVASVAFIKFEAGNRLSVVPSIPRQTNDFYTQDNPDGISER